MIDLERKGGRETEIDLLFHLLTHQRFPPVHVLTQDQTLSLGTA